MVPKSSVSPKNWLAPPPPILHVVSLLLLKLVSPILMLPLQKPEPLKLVLLPPKAALALLLFLLSLLFFLSSSGREEDVIPVVLFEMAPGAGAEEAVAVAGQAFLFPAAAYPAPQAKKLSLSIVCLFCVGSKGRNEGNL
ncbi:MAG: hypothetical protein JOS17DRAFT_762233 [Linnemannia elongata]|nr:MAG: hypothetical protein JOS17DRAFT_762233 [Linnemannia elongata]